MQVISLCLCLFGGFCFLGAQMHGMGTGEGFFRWHNILRFATDCWKEKRGLFGRKLKGWVWESYFWKFWGGSGWIYWKSCGLLVFDSAFLIGNSAMLKSRFVQEYTSRGTIAGRSCVKISCIAIISTCVQSCLSTSCEVPGVHFPQPSWVTHISIPHYPPPPSACAKTVKSHPIVHLLSICKPIFSSTSAQELKSIVTPK